MLLRKIIIKNLKTYLGGLAPRRLGERDRERERPRRLE